MIIQLIYSSSNLSYSKLSFSMINGLFKQIPLIWAVNYCEPQKIYVFLIITEKKQNASLTYSTVQYHEMPQNNLLTLKKHYLCDDV